MTKVSKLVAAMGIAFATIGTVNAQDWSGFYAGATLGKSSIDTSWTDLDYDWVGYNVEVGSYDEDSAAVGLNVGYNWQVGNMVFGVAGGFAYQDVSNTTFEFDDVYIDNSLSFTADLRATGGYAIGKFLPYVTAGVAISDLEHSWHEINDTPDSWPDFENKTAVVYGVGVEYSVNDKISVGAQWLRYDFGDETSTNPLGYRMEVETEMDRFSASMNFHF